MFKILVFSPLGGLRLILYSILAVFVIPMSIVNLMLVFKLLGFPAYYGTFVALTITGLSLLGSVVHVAVYETKYKAIMPSYVTIDFMGFQFRLPSFMWQIQRSIVSINVGGAIIPTAMSIVLMYVMWDISHRVLAGVIISLLLTTLIVNRAAKVVPGIGITTPAFLPPLVSAIATTLIIYVMSPTLLNASPAAAYIVGVLSSLIGADLMHLREVIELSPAIIDIGGMGTFDGIYLSGVLAIFYAMALTLIIG